MGGMASSMAPPSGTFLRGIEAMTSARCLGTSGSSDARLGRAWSRRRGCCTVIVGSLKRQQGSQQNTPRVATSAERADEIGRGPARLFGRLAGCKDGVLKGVADRAVATLA